MTPTIERSLSKRKAKEMDASDSGSIRRGSNQRKAAKVEARKIHLGDDKADETEFDSKRWPYIKIESDESDSDKTLRLPDVRQASGKELPDMEMGSNEVDFANALFYGMEPNDAGPSHRGLRIYPDIIESMEAEYDPVMSDVQEPESPEWEPEDQGPNRFTVSPESGPDQSIPENMETSDENTVSDVECLSHRSPYTGIRQLNHRDVELVCSSEPVEFRVGPNSTPYHLSKPLVCSISELLLRTISSQKNRLVPRLDWRLFIDKDIFGLFVQFIYTGDYEIPQNFDQDLAEHRQASLQQLGEQLDQELLFQIYAKSPAVNTGCPTSEYRQHAQVWAFATEIEFTDLADVAVKKLRDALKALFPSFGVRNYLRLLLPECEELVDMFGYVYSQADRLEETRLGGGQMNKTPLTNIKLELARFARKYMSDFAPDEAQRRVHADLLGLDVHFDPQRYQKLEIWMQLLEGHPQIAVDMIRVNILEFDEPFIPIVQLPRGL